MSAMKCMENLRHSSADHLQCSIIGHTPILRIVAFVNSNSAVKTVRLCQVARSALGRRGAGETRRWGDGILTYDLLNIFFHIRCKVSSVYRHGI